MKRQTKIIVAVISVLIMLGIGLGVKKHMDDKAFREEMIIQVKKHKNLVEDDLMKLDKNKYIKSIQIDYSKVEHNPMGGIIIYGYVNNDKSLKFSSGIDRYNEDGKNQFKSDGTDPSEKLFELLGSDN